MLLHQKLRLQREKNKLELDQMRYYNLQTRMKTKVNKRENYFTKLEKQLERQANAYKNSANMFFSQQFGLGTGAVNMGNYMGSSAAAMQIIQQWGNTNPYDGSSFNADVVMQVMQGSGNIKSETKDGKTIYTNANGENITSDVEQANKIISLANSAVTQQQAMASQYKANYENNVSIWLDAQKEQLDAQREWEMDLLSEEQADIDAKVKMNEAQITMVDNMIQSVDQRLGKEAQDSAPKFGLA